MGDVDQDVAALFGTTPSDPVVNPDVKQWVVDPVPAEQVKTVESADVLDLTEPVVDEVKAEHDRLLAKVNELRGDRTEDNIGLSDDYWKVLNQLRMHIHNNK